MILKLTYLDGLQVPSFASLKELRTLVITTWSLLFCGGRNKIQNKIKI